MLVPPFDHPDIIAGQGTIGLEIAEDLPAVENVLVPVSGGGLASGIGTAIKALCPQARVFGVEPELAADTAEGIAQGHRVDWSIEDRNRTIADGLRSQPSELTFAHLQAVLDGVITVSESEIRSAVRELAIKSHLVSEPSGAVALAAYRQGADTAGPHSDGAVRRQHRSRDAQRDSGGLSDQPAAARRANGTARWHFSRMECSQASMFGRRLEMVAA